MNNKENNNNNNKNNSKKNKIIKIVMFIVGAILIMYPLFSKVLLSYFESKDISKYQERVDTLTTNKIDDELNDADKYNKGLTDPKASSKDYPSYINVLTDDNGLIGYIRIPKIDVYLPIYHGTTENILQSGVGHLDNSSLPTGGEGTHSVLVGHSGLVRTKMFDDIDKLEKGDYFYINVLSRVLVYKVDEIKTVNPDDLSVTQIYEGKDYVTLVTCTPKYINTYRLLVRGERVPDDEVESKNKIDEAKDAEQARKELEELQKKRLIDIIVCSVGCLIVIVTIVVIIVKKKDKNNKILENKEEEK